MSTTRALFQHHKHCDEIFANAEDSCGKGDWGAGAKAFESFARELETHFLSEEEVLFPAFESATGMRGGPTEVMRGEHRQMRALIGQMRAAIEARDADDFAGNAETLLIMMQQHNMKEENILYPMCDNALGSSDVGGTIVQRLAAA